MTLVLWTHSGPPGAKHEAGSASAASGTRKRLQDGTHIFFCLFQFYLFWLHWLFIAVFRFSLVAASTSCRLLIAVTSLVVEQRL